jgi:fatty-acyl-CoA synthase
MAMAVPTIWLAMLQYLKETDQDLGRLERILTGGTAPPRALMEALARDYGVATTHGWGMTETSAGTTMSMPDPGLEGDAALDARLNQGKPVYGAEMRLTGDDGQPLAWDGRSAGELLVRGYWVSSAYYRRDDVAALDGEGWLRTGDMAVIDQSGTMRLTDRLKDVIKSGGEWISSIDLENAAVGHPDVAEAAVIAIPHPKWQERPMLVAVPTPDAQVTAEDLRDWLAGRVAKWWLPDEVRFADELPHTGTGKVDKVALRQRFAAETGA